MKDAVRAVLFLCLLGIATSAMGRDLPNFDAVAQSRVIPNAEAALAERTAAYVRPGTRAQGDDRFGVPTFLWAGRNVAVPALRQGAGAGTPQEAAARAHLANYADLYHLSAQDVATATVRYVHDIGKGPVIVKFIQKVGDVEILLEETSVVMNRQLDLVAITGFISTTATPSADGASWGLDASEGAAAAYNDLTGGALPANQLVAAGSRNGYDYFGSAQDIGLDIPIRIRRVYYHLPEGLVPAYHVEVAIRNQPAAGELREASSGDLDYYAYVISAHDGSLLLRRNLAAHAESDASTRVRGQARASLGGGGGFTYRVWADPITKIPLDGPQGNDFQPKLNPVNDNVQPTLIPSDLVTLSNYPFSMNDPWLPPGSTETVGNNVDAYVDLVAPNGYGVTGPPSDGISNDFRAQLTAVDTFGNNYDTTVRPNNATQRLASIQQMFYNMNFLHDWFYDYGFDEASLNAQTDNFGRGGLGNDPINAEGQDMGSLDNANMNTPADGARPRMQMYIFQAQANSIVANPPGQAPSTNDGRFTEIQSPASIATVLGSGTVQFGQQPFDMTNELILANPPAACAALTNAAAVAGKIVLVERQATGGPVCALQAKIANAQNAGAVGFLLINNQATPTQGASFLGFINTGPTGVPPNGPVTMALGTMTWNQALPIKAELAVPNVVTARIKRIVDRDGTIDTQVMMHEWGHYLQNRLIGNSLGLINNQGGSMGEGWGDFTALLFTVREDDVLVPSNANWNGVYSLASYVLTGGNTSQAAYFGIRRYPQTTDMTKNPLTLRHIVTGEPLPPGIPLAPKSPNNAEVHNAGEVWAVALWECYAALLRDTLGPTPRLTFQQARDRMNMYYVVSLKMTPLRPTLLSARDAMLAAAYANDAVDYALFWRAFAKRGYGLNAVAADPYSATHAGTVEDFTVGGQLLFQAAELNTPAADCDGDLVLDSGDTFALRVRLRNMGDRPLSATTGFISSSDPNVTLAGGGTITFSPSEPLETSIGSTAISYAAGIAGIQTIPIQISFDDPDLAVPGPRIVNLGLRVNTNTILNSTATDTVESERLAQTPTVVTGTAGFSTNTPWRRSEASPSDHRWFGTDPDAMQDQALVSPVMTVNGGGALTLEFDHSWGFEFDPTNNFDGGVVEMSVNGGAWTDIGVGGVNSYNGTILNQGPASNPLGGRPAFVQDSPGTVHTTLTQAIAPGSTVQVRFRLGSDQFVGAAGWNVDNFAFNGVVETPFDTVVADPGCIRATTTTLGSDANPSPFGNSVTLTATVASLAGAPGGSVAFLDGAANLGSAPLVGGVANLVTSTLAIGAHSLTASYTGATGFAGSASAPFVQTITKAASAIDGVSSLDPTTVGQAVTFTATVSGGVGTPTGTVTFVDGATTLGAMALNGSGAAALATSALTCGTHTINANYGGSGTYAAATDSLVQTVLNPTAPAASNTGPYCEGGTIQLSTPDVPGATYAWTGPGGFVSSNRTPTLPATAAAAGAYQVRVTLAGCTTVPGSTTVVVNAVPATPTPSNTGPYTRGDTIELTTPDVPGGTFAWTGPSGFTSTDREPTIPDAQVNRSGTYSVTVTANSCSSAAGSTNVVVALSPGSFFAVTPCRLFDSRSGSPLAQNVVRAVNAVGSCGIPSSGVRALALNITAVNSTAAGHIVADSIGTSSGISVINFAAGRNRANNAIVQVSGDGLVFLMPVLGGTGNTVHVVLDVVGYFE